MKEYSGRTLLDTFGSRIGTNNTEHGGDWFSIKHLTDNKCIALRDSKIVVEVCKNGVMEQLWTQYDTDFLVRPRNNPNKCVFATPTGHLFMDNCFAEGEDGAVEAYDDSSIRHKSDPNKCWTDFEESVIVDDCPIGEVPTASERWMVVPLGVEEASEKKV